MSKQDFFGPKTSRILSLFWITVALLGSLSMISIVFYFLSYFKEVPFCIFSMLKRNKGATLCIYFLIVSLVSLFAIVSCLYFYRLVIQGISQRNRKLDFFTSLYSVIDIGLVIFNTTYEIEYCNNTSLRILNKNSAECKPGVLYTSIIDPVLSPVMEKLATAIQQKESFTREYRIFLPEGIRCIQCDFVIISGAQNDEIFFALALADRTREDTVRQKLSVQLEETHKHAIAKDNFFANMSHEIRTPINAILGMTYFAKTVIKDPKGIEYIKKIEKASDILLGVVNDILDFSKMQEHKFTLSPTHFKLYDLRKMLLDLFGLKAEQKDLSFKVDFDCDESFFVFGDQFRLTQVFMNLVGNAIKFTNKGFVSVSVSHEIVAKNVILRCTVRDSGVGLSEEALGKLFLDFEQFGSVLIKSHEGTGLGLAISKRLVELMNGVIWVDSTINVGSSFHFVVVLRKTESVFEPSQVLGAQKINLKNNRVLLVEDNEINAEIAITLLTEAGCKVDRAEDGVDAVTLCKEHPKDYYDLVLMDIHMPRMNGYEAARILKKDIKIKGPIIAVTATSDDVSDVEANRDVIANYLLKPYDPLVFKNLFE